MRTTNFVDVRVPASGVSKSIVMKIIQYIGIATPLRFGLRGSLTLLFRKQFKYEISALVLKDPSYARALSWLR